MATHVAFLRGINVGGHRVTNDELRSLVADAGIAEVATYRASGNLLLTTDGSRSSDELEQALASVLADGLGYAVPTFVRTAAQVRAVADRDPVPDAADGGKLHVAFLRAPFTDRDLDELHGFLFSTDRVVAAGTELYWHMATGRMMESAMTRPEVERLMGDRWTVRTAGTVAKMAAKLSA